MMQRLVLVAALLPLSGLAQEDYGPLRYDYITASLVMPELDEIGFELDASIGVTEDLIVFGAFRTWEPGHRVDIDTLQIGVGHIWPIQPNVDVIASLSYADNDIDRPGPGRADEEGLVLSGQVRAWATPRIELAGSVSLDNSTGSSTDTILEMGLQYFHETNLSYGGRIRADEDDTVLFLGARFYFGASRR
jgi:hypothetical protein